MPQIGLAKQTFLTLYQRAPWLKEAVVSRWPFLDLLFSQQRIKEVDYSLIKRLLQNFPDASQELALFLCYLILATKEGHLCVRIDTHELMPTVNQLWQNEEGQRLTQEEELFLKHSIQQGAQQVPQELLTHCSTETKVPITPICYEGQDFYLQRHWVFETLFLKSFKFHLEQPPDIELESEKINQAVNELQKQNLLLQEQAQAIKQSCLNAFSIIIGGPGTGKTYTAGHLIQIFWQQLTLEQKKTFQIVLAAPTGKAAANLQRSFKKVAAHLPHFSPIQAKTLRALLGIKSKGKTEPVRLTADLILVDESSMIDVRLMACLFESLKSGSRLILLGDPYQLPSVEAGGVFADLIHIQQLYPHLNIPLTRLNICLRAELHSLIEFAQLINQGQGTEVLSYLNQTNQIGIKRLNFPEGKKEAQKSFVDYVCRQLPKRSTNLSNASEFLHLFNQIRVLSPIRKGPWGAETLNQLIWEQVSQHSSLEEWIVIPIMICTNDYAQDLFNGETGILIRKTPLQPLGLGDYALFPSRHSDDEVRQIPALLLPRYEYAYCLSVHKSQGSEFDRVVLVLPEGSELFGREVIYTAVTRARQQIEIYGSDLIIDKTVRQQGFRLSGIKRRF